MSAKVILITSSIHKTTPSLASSFTASWKAASQPGDKPATALTDQNSDEVKGALKLYGLSYVMIDDLVYFLDETNGRQRLCILDSIINENFERVLR